VYSRISAGLRRGLPHPCEGPGHGGGDRPGGLYGRGAYFQKRRFPGTRLIVRADDAIVGTIGGGSLEAQVQKMAKEVLRDQKAVVKRFVFSAADAASMGMIRGGQIETLINYVNESDPASLRFYRELLAALESCKRAFLITRIPAAGGGQPRLHLARSDGTSTDDLDQQLVQGLIAQAGLSQPGVICEGEDFLVEPLCHEGTVFIFGAGHIGEKLVPLTKLVGFRTVVLDDREEFANRQKFSNADEIIVLDSFESALQGLDIDQDCYVVIVTPGHTHDKTVLRQALRTDAGYIGMIGSRRKRDAVYEALNKEGFDRQVFNRVHSPIGLDINAESPEEIGVCIVAELIQGRAGKEQ
jgi:xanthine dehydrogenase accessory factor